MRLTDNRTILTELTDAITDWARRLVRQCRAPKRPDKQSPAPAPETYEERELRVAIEESERTQIQARTTAERASKTLSNPEKTITEL